MAGTALSAAFLGACTKEVEPTAPAPAQDLIGARIKAFVHNASNARQGTPKDGEAYSMADAVWYLEAGLNYATGDFRKAYNDLAEGSITVPLAFTGGQSSASSVYAAFNAALDAIAPLTTDDQHVVLVDVVEPEEGATALIVQYQIGSGYEKVNNPPNTTYTTSHWWGNSLGQSNPCDCTGNLDPNRRCANKEIEWRMNAANLYALQPGEFLTDVETWTVRDQTTNTAQKKYSYLDPLMAGPAPLGDGHRDTKTFYARSNSTPTEPNCLPSASMAFWTGNTTTGTWSAVMAIRNLHCPTKRFLSSTSEAHSWSSTGGNPPTVHRLHRWSFTYGIIQAGAGS
jgi:hypothetical protein